MIIRLPIGILESNGYLACDEISRQGVVIDPGGDLTSLQVEIQRREIQVRYILNTHGHFDHIAANAGLIAALIVPLGLHPADRELLLAGGGAAWYGQAYVPSPPPTLDLEDGLVLKTGALHIEVIHTPGHTPGSVCFYIPQDGALITGDTLFAGSVGRADLPGGNARELAQSLRRLLAFPETTRIYPGHGPSSTLAQEKRYNPWLQRLSHNLASE